MEIRAKRTFLGFLTLPFASGPRLKPNSSTAPWTRVFNALPLSTSSRRERSVLILSQMATEAQIQANRRNALKSTGPTTPEGKAASSRNALRHGVHARHHILPFEDGQEFRRLACDLSRELDPQNLTESLRVENIISAAWRLHRARSGPVLLESACHPSGPGPQLTRAS